MDPTQQIPNREDNNILVAAWNIKWLGLGDSKDIPKVAQVLALFDVCGIMEIRRESVFADLAGELQRQTGHAWGYVYGVKTKRPAPRSNYYESYGFVWRRDRVFLGNGIVSNIWDRKEKYRNDPFVASFHRGDFDFAMALVHTRWSDDPDGTRHGEIDEIVEQIKFMKTFVPERDLILSGDFNESGASPVMLQMAAESNLRLIDDNAKSTFKTDGTGFASSYDHMLIGDRDKTTLQRLDGRCTTLDICHVLFGDNDPGHMQTTRSTVSDHLPVFANSARKVFSRGQAGIRRVRPPCHPCGPAQLQVG